MSVTNGDVIDNDDGTYTFRGDQDFNGTAYVNYLIKDGQGGSISNTVELTVDSVNDAPEATYTDTSDAFEDSSALTVQLTSFDVDEFAENGTTPESANYKFVSAFIDDLDVDYDSNSQLSGTFRDITGGQLADDQSISFVSAKITTPDDVTTDIDDLANLGGFTIDTATGTWSFDASHADYQDLDITSNQTTEILIEYNIELANSAEDPEPNLLRLRVYPQMDGEDEIRTANASVQIDAVQGLKYYNASSNAENEEDKWRL